MPQEQNFKDTADPYISHLVQFSSVPTQISDQKIILSVVYFFQRKMKEIRNSIFIWLFVFTRKMTLSCNPHGTPLENLELKVEDQKFQIVGLKTDILQLTIELKRLKDEGKPRNRIFRHFRGRSVCVVRSTAGTLMIYVILK